jgi:hypothetical protein
VHENNGLHLPCGERAHIAVLVVQFAHRLETAASCVVVCNANLFCLFPPSSTAGAAAALPSFIDRRITKHAGKENGAGKGGGRGSGSSQNKSCAGSSRRRHEPPRRDLRSRLQHRYLPRTRSSAAHARAVVPGMLPHVGRGLLGEGAFDTRGHGYALLLQGQSTLGTELNTAWASARGQLNAALQVSASAPSARLREVQVSMAAAAKDGARSRAWEAHAAAAAALTGQNADQGAGSASSSSTSKPWTRHSASGL